MRSISTLATLLVGLATTAALVVTVIGPLHAGHEGGGTGHGGGGGGGEPVLSPPVVVDSTGAVVGLAVGTFGGPHGQVLFRLDDGRPVILRVEADRMLYGNELQSLSLECGGPFFRATGSVPELLLPLATVGPVGPDDWIYIADDLSVTEEVTTLSSWNSNQQVCTPLEQTSTQYVQFEPVMQLDFVPPFHIE